MNVLESVIEHYRVLAGELSLNFDFINQSFLYGRSPRLKGKINNRQVQITCHIRATNNKDPITYAEIEVSCQLPKNTTLILYREGLGDRLKVLLGMQDIQFNDKGFDDNFIIKSNNEQFTRLVLNPDLRDHLVRDMGLISGYKIGPIHWQLQLPSNPFLEKTVDLTDVLDFPQQGGKANKKQITFSNKKNVNSIQTKFLHNVENNLKLGWIHRSIETTNNLADNIELAAKELKLYS